MNYTSLAENLKPDIIGGEYLVQTRAQFDKDDRNIIVSSDRYVLQFHARSGELVNRVTITESESESESDENPKIASCERLDNSLYIFTTTGKILIWGLDTQDWVNELALPLEEGETLVSCKVLSKRQYVYGVRHKSIKKANLYYSMSRSERERPKSRVCFGSYTTGEQNTFDIGCLLDKEEKSSRESRSASKSSKQRCLTFINHQYVYFQKVAIGEKLVVETSRQRMSAEEGLTCVRANPKRPMVAVGDTLGRIYVFSIDLGERYFARTKLHWHTLPVNDLCFSSTGNTLFSVGGESGCVVVWDLTSNNLGKKHVIARLGMPIRFINCGNYINQLILSFEDNEIQIMDTNETTQTLKTFTRRTIDMYRANDYRALRIDKIKNENEQCKSVGLLWHSKTDTVVTNARTGWLQFYSPRKQTRTDSLNFLKSGILTLEKEGRVIPSDITKASISLDGNWIAFYEVREAEGSFPDLKLHIWQRSATTQRWVWIQTADRLHSSNAITDLKFSPDGQYLVSVCDDGTFYVLHRVSFDSKTDLHSSGKQMYAKGFMGNVPEKLSSMATFSQDSSVLAMSLKNDTTLIWMIVDPYKLVYECQLNQIEASPELPTNGEIMEVQPVPSHEVLGLHFGYHKPSQSLAPLCEVRSRSIRLWNILNPSETMEYNAQVTDVDCDEFTAAAFDQCSRGDDNSLDHFAVSTKRCFIMVFKLHIARTTNDLQPLITINCSMPFSVPQAPLYYTHMCFVEKPILDIDEQCHEDSHLVKIVSRLCLMTNYQELVAVTDKLTLERQSAKNSCNRVKSFDMSELQAYFLKNASAYGDETRGLKNTINNDSKNFTEKQRKIRNRLEVQKMLKNLVLRIPSHNLPKMETLGPMILNKLI